MTLGIQPTFPNTGFGYIEYDKTDANPIKKVSQFREKPDYETAKSFLQSGNFLWNGGIFIWSARSITEAFEKFQPQMNALFHKGFESYNTPAEKSFIEENYALAENVSIDYAVMESARNVYVLPATFDWNDLGTWGSIKAYKKAWKELQEMNDAYKKEYQQAQETNKKRYEKD